MSFLIACSRSADSNLRKSGQLKSEGVGWRPKPALCCLQCPLPPSVALCSTQEVRGYAATFSRIKVKPTSRSLRRHFQRIVTHMHITCAHRDGLMPCQLLDGFDSSALLRQARAEGMAIVVPSIP